MADVYPSATKTLSTVLRETGVDRVDLLKIDAEGSEAEILEGIEDGHWKRFHQIVIEVHGRGGGRDFLAGLLEDRGFHVILDRQESLLRDTDLSTLFARREDVRSDTAVVPASGTSTVGLSARPAPHLVDAIANLQHLVKAPCIICLCPSFEHPDGGEQRRMNRAEQELATALAVLPGVTVVTGVEIGRALDSSESGQDGLFTALAEVATQAYRSSCFES
ncbi:FkbM family methyltransferase [Frankia sp. AgKG'84/4]|uniref:FkbM family methyltransferase n=1 Tax=Frankia sp. AgKG'84/4 TaxID=573490 RepID=UPI002543E9BA